MTETTQISKKDPIFLYFLIFILFLTSMNLWIGWNGRSKYIYMCVGLIALLYVCVNHVKINLDKRNVFSFIVLCIAYIYISHIGLGSIFEFFIPLYVIIFLENSNKVECIYYITKWFSLLLIPAIIIFVLYQTVGFPSFGTLVFNDFGNQSYEYLHRSNFVFYNYTDYYGIRFNGPFLEPGHLGMIGAFLLLATGFDFKRKETWIILCSIFLTLSLAGYMLTIIGFMLLKYYREQISIKFIILFLLLIAVLYIFSNFYNGGDNLINEKIFSRLEPDEEKGFSGNNRVFGEVNLYFLNMFNDKKLLLYGYDENTIDYLAETGSRGTGFIMYMVRHGIIGTVIVSLFYLFYSILSKDKKIAFLFFVFVALMYWQRSYPFWYSWFICYTCGILRYESIIKRNEDRNIDIS